MSSSGAVTGCLPARRQALFVKDSATGLRGVASGFLQRGEGARLCGGCRLSCRLHVFVEAGKNVVHM